MRFRDPSRNGGAEGVNWERLKKRVRQQAGQLSYPKPIVEFPQLGTFKIDEGPLVRWETPIIWGDSDLIAGKRKVNLIFTLIEHCLSILEDLGADDSSFRPYLEQAWGRDTTGQQFRFQPGLVQSVFQGILNDFPFDELYASLWDKAKDAFHDDYEGRRFAAPEEGTKERWEWLQETFLKEAGKRLDEQRAVLAWRAIDDTFALTVFDNRPRPSRDHDAAAYTFPFNQTIAELNARLREKICTLT